jgi:tRNA pseudouridine32 synthase/23S rRNA pseudouridine746 synthase
MELDAIEIRRRVLYQDKDIVVLNKPSGISVQDDPAKDGPALGPAFGGPAQTGFFHRVKDALDLPDACPVHRLDKGTSGLYLVAKNASVAAFLGQQFTSGQVCKGYLALSHNKGHKKQGWVKGDMAAARRGNHKLLKTSVNPALTWFHSKSLRPGVRAFALKLYTGKTHQARVALKSTGSPILGDERYGGLPADRLYLHAAMLTFTLPSGDPLQLRCLPAATEGAGWEHPEQAAFYAALLDGDWPPPPAGTIAKATP